MPAHGLLLAAGAGRRMGRPKALVDGWLAGSVRALRGGGCPAVTVVLGAAANQATPLLAGLDVAVVVADEWAEGMGASLRTGLAALDPAAADAAVITLVDLPDVGSEVVARLLRAPYDAGSLRRATFRGVPGHPVLLGRDHWAAVLAGAEGDRGARDYLARHHVDEVECADLATGDDVDAAPDEPTSGQRARG